MCATLASHIEGLIFTISIFEINTQHGNTLDEYCKPTGYVQYVLVLGAPAQTSIYSGCDHQFVVVSVFSGTPILGEKKREGGIFLLKCVFADCAYSHNWSIYM